MLPLVGSAYNVGMRTIVADDGSAALSITQNGAGPVLEASGTAGLVFALFNTEIDFHNNIFMLHSPDHTPNYGLFNIGPGPWDGTSVGHYVGSNQGTLLAGNAASGFAGNLLDLQIDGVSKASITKDGDGVFHNVITASSGQIGPPVGPFWNWQLPNIIRNNNAGLTTFTLVINAVTGQTNDVQTWNNGVGGAIGGITASGTIYSTSGLAAARRTATTTDQATINDYSIWCDATTAAFTETLPAANTCKNGQMIAVTKIDSSANAVTVAAKGTDTVNGAASISLSALDSTAILITDGVGKWWEIG